ncbi:NADH-quinone oxidoreductase subunit NuoG [Hirschia litorea]|uniref:NADH-quinone oxidoreductase n=1 Tax=Hirschia litorea TaxID=1199156 RepID=A0ABW2IHK0_9PROT
MADTAKVVVDGVEVEVPRNYSLLQACEEAGAEIPRFCYHERLSIAGNCRMCLVDWVGAPKPIASCAQAVGDMRPNQDGSPPQISTKSERAIKARNGVMEFLLINHPLDCPICDQGGECDLQDQAMGFGRSVSRYREPKRAVDDKNMGPLVNTIMTRCIQCTRCVRFAAEVAGVEEIGLISRGEDAQITTYLEASLQSELSGNVIDLCPVGALTSKPYAFNARPWELRKTESVDVMDAMGASIRVDARGSAVLRVLPRINEEINEEWISDKTRFAIDGLGRQRLDKPFIRKNGKLVAASWDEALELVSSKLKGDASKIAAIAGDLACVEGMKATLDLLRSIGVKSIDCRQDGAQLALDIDGNLLPRESYIFNSSIMGIDDADYVLIIGANPRKEAAVLNARIRKNWLHRDMPVALIGESVDLTYSYTHLGNGIEALQSLKPENEVFEMLKQARRPMIILGQSAVSREDGASVLASVSQLAEQVGCFTSASENEEAWNGFNVLHNAAGRVGGLDIGFLPIEDGLDVKGILNGAQNGSIETIISLGADEIVGDAFGEAFVVYIGTHGDEGAHRADVILPSATYTEKSATYVNTEGRVQRTQRAVGLKGESREDWSILRALSTKLGAPLPYDSLTELRSKMNQDKPVFKGLDVAPFPTGEVLSLPFGKIGQMSDAPFAEAVGAFHLTNPIARASKTMAECAELAVHKLSTAAE